MMTDSLQNELPRLSLVVPVRNGVQYIRDTLDSLERLEGVLSCELIFQDCLSTDGTSEILADFCQGKDNRFHFNEQDVGQSDAINTGVKKATGKWVTWLCADDIILPDLASAIGEAEDAGAHIVYGDIIFWQQGNFFPAIGTETHCEGALAKKRLIIQQPGTCILKATWDEFKGVRQHLNWSMDYDLFMRLEAEQKIFLRANHFVAVIRIHKEAKTSSGSVKRVLELWKVIYESHKRRPDFFRVRPYVVYGVEYIIKSLESLDRIKGIFPLAQFIKIMHKIFWRIALPSEQAQIAERFGKLRAAILSFVTS